MAFFLVRTAPWADWLRSILHGSFFTFPSSTVVLIDSLVIPGKMSKTKPKRGFGAMSSSDSGSLYLRPRCVAALSCVSYPNFSSVFGSGAALYAPFGLGASRCARASLTRRQGRCPSSPFSALIFAQITGSSCDSGYLCSGVLVGTLCGLQVCQRSHSAGEAAPFSRALPVSASHSAARESSNVAIAAGGRKDNRCLVWQGRLQFPPVRFKLTGCSCMQRASCEPGGRLWQLRAREQVQAADEGHFQIWQQHRRGTRLCAGCCSPQTLQVDWPILVVHHRCTFPQQSPEALTEPPHHLCGTSPLHYRACNPR